MRTDPTLQKVLSHYNLPFLDISAERLSEGANVNQTWKILDSQKNAYILQRLSPIFTDDMSDTASAILQYLQTKQWEVPTIVGSKEQTMSVRHDDSLWRLSTYIHSDGALPPLRISVFSHTGKLLRQLHQSLHEYTLDLRPTLAHYRDHQYYMELLERSSYDSPALQKISKNILQLFEHLSVPYSDYPTQIVHGDPKLANILYRNKLPFTYIDWDTVMRHSILVDVGDFVRSTLKVYGDIVSVSDLEAFCVSYLDVSSLNIPATKLLSDALNSAQAIELENSAKRILDAGGNYWNNDTGSSHEVWVEEKVSVSFSLIKNIESLKQSLKAS